MTEPIAAQITGAIGLTGVKIELVYDPTEPYTVFMYIWNWYGKHWLEWVCERDLLAQALEADTDGTVTGELDMLITRVDDRTTKITKVTRGEWHERTEVVLGSARLTSFLKEAFALVPPGHERIELDVEQLLR
ncbi:hypothetical protein ADK67_14795 [Saccharothrix sp. NRRL B-16348]|uniref:SsgA family sporulation/cell division regulator n=1 Tax=Saccharothrix sp. NRRL B-16348 TaxID=1415542 RepID=UPI0006AE8E17|nr:SsgA family sporulation/cell division regulator [Saccharothrix sp. NRRL B-16348]KOX27084.1 hypothetical protein ADK67_14795 [Saccharothrix sp. NRRL B-16348]